MQPVVQLIQDECLGLMPGSGGAWVVAFEICSHRVLVHNGALLYFCAKLLQRAGAHGRRGAHLPRTKLQLELLFEEF